MPISNSHDALWTLNGDLVKNGRGGISTTHDYQPFLSKRQIIRNRIKAAKEDWKLYNKMAAGLDRFIGSTNSQTTGKIIENAIITALTYDRFIDPVDIQVKAVPISQNTIAVRTKVKGITPNGIESIYEVFTARSRAHGGVGIVTSK